MRFSGSSVRRCSGAEGFALPVALLGIVLVSVLITTVLVSSSTEVALSNAQQDATSSFYATQGAIETYVNQQGALLVPTSGYVTHTSPDGQFEVRVDELHRVFVSDLPDPQRLYSIAARPTNGGRELSAMVKVGPLILGIKSAATFGGDATIRGSTLVSDGSDTTGIYKSCSELAPNAITHADGTAVDTVGSHVAIVGGVTESDLNKEDLIRATLGGYSIREFLRHVDGKGLGLEEYVTFGDNAVWGEGDIDSFSGSMKANSLNGDGTAKAHDLPYNWYCPGKVETDQHCAEAPGIDTTAYKIVAIDGDSSDVNLQGDHGQGMLVVVNGNLKISGNFIFRGIILSEGDIVLTGTGNKVEGAIISMNEIYVDRPSNGESDVLGNAVVRYNKCAIDRVIQTISPGGAPPAVGQTVAWAEVVR